MRTLVLVAVGVGVPTIARAEPTPVTVYLRADGGTLTAGWDDSTADVSSVVLQRESGEVAIPKWKGGAKKWKRVARCVRDGFAPFAIDVVEQRPARGDYVMVMVGGRSRLFGYNDRVTGISPYTAEPIPRAVSFVFPENIANDVEGTCISILHEVGHTLGLDHSLECADPMSYLFGCGKKSWQDVDADCGEDAARDCGDGHATQNSYRLLAAAVGLRGDGRTEPEPEPEPEPMDPYDPDPDAELAEPTITLETGDLSEDRMLTLTAEASSPAGVHDVALVWVNGDQSFVIPCAEIPDEVPATCRRDGDRFTFRIKVGTGTRAVAAAVIGRDGAHAVTEPQRFRLE